MTLSLSDVETRRSEWVRRVESLVDQVADWAAATGWPVRREQKLIREKSVGEYEVPVLHVEVPGRGEVCVNPITIATLGGRGRVDVEAIPTIARVKFLSAPDGWTIMTDSNVPLRVPWTRESFVQLAHDLLG
jgi:hypothetical protein